MRDRRRAKRRKVLKEGKIMLAGGVAVNCIVRDISPGGARLELDGPVCLPGEFRLRIVAADLTLPAVPAWQRRDEVGVRFTGVGVSGEADGDPMRAIATT